MMLHSNMRHITDRRFEMYEETQIDLAILDVMLPILTGFIFVRRSERSIIFL